MGMTVKKIRKELGLPPRVRRWSQVMEVLKTELQAARITLAPQAGVRFTGSRVPIDAFHDAVRAVFPDDRILFTGRDPFPQVEHVAEDMGYSPVFERTPPWDDTKSNSENSVGYEGYFATVEAANRLFPAYCERVRTIKGQMREEENGVTVAMMCEMFGIRAPRVLCLPAEYLDTAWGGRRWGPRTHALPRKDAKRLADRMGWCELPEQQRRPYGRRRKTLLSAGITLEG